MTLVVVLSYVVLAAALVVFAATMIILVEVVASRRAMAKTDDNQVTVQEPLPRFAVLIPAHDEALGIAATLNNLRPQAGAEGRIVVVADNCSDETARIASQAGAEVVVRTDATRRGKGYALDFGVRYLAADPPEVVVIVDADCALEPGSLATIVSLSAQTGRPVQARYDFERPPRMTGMAFATFAARLKNYLRPLGLKQLGFPCALLGTGMAFPWRVIAHANLASGEIVEDMVLGLELARNGTPAIYCPQALVRSYFPASVEGQSSQRARWETGHLRTIVDRLPAMFWQALRQGNLPAIALILDTAVPPLALLAILIAGIGAVALGLALLGGPPAALIISLAAALVFTGSALLAWMMVGRDVLSLQQLLMAPGYVLAKLALYARVMIGKRVPWIRSKREE
ncbi:MAG: glycosyltransferase family 2 protein [Hyphomicrobiaceae bacterium]|nr:glycosyltransferase family 2 protein [Hyphomicrobiaceae bacterium]